MAVTKIKTVAQAEKDDRRQTIVIVVLSAVCLFGFSYVIYDYIQITNRIALPESLAEVDPVVKQLEADGLVVSFDIPEARLTVAEDKWHEISREEKIGLITQLARYCADKNKSDFWTLSVVAHGTRRSLGELGMMGLTVE